MLSGKQLKLLRIEQDIEAKYIAEKLKVSKPYISIMERGRQAIPDHIYKKWVEILKFIDDEAQNNLTKGSILTIEKS